LKKKTELVKNENNEEIYKMSFYFDKLDLVVKFYRKTKKSLNNNFELRNCQRSEGEWEQRFELPLAYKGSQKYFVKCSNGIVVFKFALRDEPILYKIFDLKIDELPKPKDYLELQKTFKENLNKIKNNPNYNKLNDDLFEWFNNQIQILNN